MVNSSSAREDCRISNKRGGDRNEARRDAQGMAARIGNRKQILNSIMLTVKELLGKLLERSSLADH
jgi:hypothetical protein